MSDTQPTGEPGQRVNGWWELGKLGLTLAALAAAVALVCRPAQTERALPAQESSRRGAINRVPTPPMPGKP